MTDPWFDDCFRERYPALVQTLHGLLGERASAEDVAQDAFVRLWEKGPRSRPDADYWVIRVARNLGYDALKTGRRRSRRELAAETIPDTPRFDDDEVTRVRTLVQELPDRDREVLLLRAFHDLPLESIAKIVGRKTNAVKQDLFRAREKLRRLWIASSEGTR